MHLHVKQFNNVLAGVLEEINCRQNVKFARPTCFTQGMKDDQVMPKELYPWRSRETNH